MRKIVLIATACLALAGCAGTWEAEVRFKVTELDEYQMCSSCAPEPRVEMELIGRLPGGDSRVRQDYSKDSVHPGEIDGEVKVGDEVVCLAKQRTIGALQTNSIQTELFQCRKA
ncbi:hypothetical protein ABZX92_12170 [Lentzea sp. NPDC006480]|uniref:hypothetical protein n=1 Tax=Lentzea sp. NPDC006480 TaxID=3157176 RepID=UPI00339FFBE7